MGLVKHGTGEVLPDPEDNQKVAQKAWTEKDDAALVRENQTPPEPSG